MGAIASELPCEVDADLALDRLPLGGRLATLRAALLVTAPGPRADCLVAQLAMLGLDAARRDDVRADAQGADLVLLDGAYATDAMLTALAAVETGARRVVFDLDASKQAPDGVESCPRPTTIGTLRDLLHGPRAVDPDPRSPALIGDSAPVRTLRSLVSRVARSEATVLVTGETGTGKEVVARNIHFASPRADGPFVAVNCGAIPEELLESELFGHEKGAFTGAVATRKGRFELARGGTLFLDEIGDMPLAMQVKLLRVLQERTFEPVGSGRTVQADVRIVAATHRDLEAAVAAGEFREDLYYRLSVFPLRTPALREHPEDLPALVSELVERQERRGGDSVAFAPCALAALAGHAWPGNVRELANVVERAAILHPGGCVRAADLPAPMGPSAIELPAAATAPEASALPEGGLDLRAHVCEIEARLIVEALERTRGTVAHAAALLGLRRTTLIEKIRKHQIVEDAAAVEPRWVAGATTQACS